MDTKELALQKHKEWCGKIEIVTRCEIKDRADLSIAYTPGVAEPCLEIAKDENLAYDYTRKGNLVAVITDGTAVLGLGDIGPSAGMPVMEGKCALFKRFANVDAFPICVDTKDVDEFVNTVANISKSFGGINLEDIGAPRCFEIERKLKERCDIPIFHDDQHGTAVVVGAALLNSVKFTGKQMGNLRVVINGAGAAGCAIGKHLINMGFGNVIMCDIHGIIAEGDENLNAGQEEMSHITNKDKEHGTLADALKGADIFIGVSRPKLVTKEMVATMNHGIVFAMANPVPEIMPDESLAGGAAIVGSGRSDYPNQINNILVFPGLFKGLLAVRAKEVTDSMKVAASHALADLIPESELRSDYVIVSAFDERAALAVANAVAKEAVRLGLNRIPYTEIK